MNSVLKWLAEIIRHNCYLLILLISSLQRLLWFQGDNSLVGGDLVPILNPFTFLGNLSYAWNDANLGALRVTAPRLFNPFYISAALTQLSGLEFSTGEKILVVSMYSLAAASIYLIWPLLFQQTRWQRSAFVASLAYVYSPYLIADGISTSVRFAVQYALVPFFLLLFMRGVIRRDLRYAVVIALFSPLVFSDFPGYQVAGYVAMSCLFYSLFHTISSRKIGFNVFFIALSSILSVLVNMWWLLPVFSNAGIYTSALTVGPGDFAAQADSTISQVFRFLGKWSFYTSYNGVSYVPYSGAYNGSPLSIALSFGPIALAFAALLIRPRNRPVLFCAWAAIIGFFLTKGINPPFGFIYQSLLSVLPPFRVYRESFYLLQVAVIPTSLLIGATIGGFFELSKIRPSLQEPGRVKAVLNQLPKNFIPIALIIIVLGASWPLLSNDISVNGLGGQSRGVKIPESYSRLVDWIGKDPASQYSKVLVLPQRGDYAAYTWGYVGGNLLYYDALPNVVLGGGTEYQSSPDSQWAASLLYQSFYTNSSAFPRLLDTFGVKYVVLENSFDTAFYGLPSIEQNRFILGQQSELVLEKNFGEISLYRNIDLASEVFVPKTFVPFGSSIEQPSGIVWQDTSFNSGWTSERWNNETTSFQAVERMLSITLDTQGVYYAGSIVKQISAPVSGARHLVVHYKTNAFTSFTVEILGDNNTYYPTAVNSPTDGQSKSAVWYTQAFDLAPDEVKPQAIRIWISNYHDRGYTGRLELWIDSISIVTSIGSTGDMISLLEDPSLQNPVSFYSTNQDTLQIWNRVNAGKLGNGTVLSIQRTDPTSYTIKIQIEGSTLLVLSQAFSEDWTAIMGGKVAHDHFKIDSFANAWLLSGNGTTTLTLEFSGQRLVSYGLVISILSSLAAMAILVRYHVRRNSARARLDCYSSPRTDPKGLMG